MRSPARRLRLPLRPVKPFVGVLKLGYRFTGILLMPAFGKQASDVVDGQHGLPRAKNRS